MSIDQIGTVKYYSPVTYNKAEFSVPVFTGMDHRPFINALDFFLALKVKKNAIKKQIYHYIERLDLKQNQDYVIKEGQDPLIDEPEYIWSLGAAHKIASIIEDDTAKAAVIFLEGVVNKSTNETQTSATAIEVSQIILYELTCRDALFTFDLLADIMTSTGYNEGKLTEDQLIEMLKKDRLLTKNGRGYKSYESCFTVRGEKTFITPYGLQFLLRKYNGLNLREFFPLLNKVVPFADMCLTHSLYNTTRIRKSFNSNDKESDNEDQI